MPKIYDAPKIWNDLADDVSSDTCFLLFRNKLKAHLFAKAYQAKIWGGGGGEI